MVTGDLVGYQGFKKRQRRVAEEGVAVFAGELLDEQVVCEGSFKC